MCGEFGEVTVIIGLVINFLAFVPPFVSFRDTLSYVINTDGTKALSQTQNTISDF